MSSPKEDIKPDPAAIDENERQYATFFQDHEFASKFPNRPINQHKTPKFSDLYLNLFEPLLAINKKPPGGPARIKPGIQSTKLSVYDQKRHIVDRFITRWRSTVGPDFFPALRLILPDKDGDRGVYNLKENAIAKLLVKLMNLDRKNSPDAHSLLHWKLPGQSYAARMAGDFPGRCFEVLSKRPIRTEPGDMTVADVNEQLDKLAAATGEAENLAIFSVFYTRMCPLELLWLIRIILKQMRIGATEKTLFNLWHRDAEVLFNVSSSLRRVCWELYDPKVSLEQDATGISLGQCFQPQLAQFQMPASWERMAQFLRPEPDDPEFWIEEKLDGERIQMHMMPDPSVPGGKRLYWFSRRTKDYTYLYGSGLEQRDSAMTKYLTDCFHENLESVILDGEMITWDPEADIIVPFGSLKTAALGEQRRTDGERTGTTAQYQPFFCVFDLLFMNGRDLTQYTLRDRRAALHRVIRRHPRAASDGSVETTHGIFRRLEVHPHIVASSADAIESALRDVINRSSEGLVLKNPRSMYRLNSRNDDWLKVKPEYMTEFGEALDCVVIGGYFGSGCRGNTLSSFLCGLRASENHIAAGTSPEKCWSFCKVGGGFTRGDYEQIKHHTDGKWRAWGDPAHPPYAYIELAGSVSRPFEKPDRWIRPQDSVVLEVKAASVTPSDSFATGKTLRFPRLRRLRLDKAWNDALSIDDFDALQARVDAEREAAQEMTAEKKSRNRPVKRARKQLVIAGAEDEGKVKLPEVDEGSKELFKGLKFCVMSDAGKPIKMSKGEIEVMISIHGGTIRQRLVEGEENRTVLISEKRSVAVASAIKRGNSDIVRPKWVTECIKQTGGGFILPYEPTHLLFAGDQMKERAKEAVDKFGDSFARDIVDVKELRELLDDMPKVEVEEGDKAFVARQFLADMKGRGIDLEEGMHGAVFRGLSVAFRLGEPQGLLTGDLEIALRGTLNRDRDRLASYVRFGGGRVVDECLEDVTHTIVVGDDPDGAKAARDEVGNREGMAVVWGEWVEASWRKRTLVDVEMYKIT